MAVLPRALLLLDAGVLWIEVRSVLHAESLGLLLPLGGRAVLLASTATVAACVTATLVPFVLWLSTETPSEAALLAAMVATSLLGVNFTFDSDPR